MQNVEHFKGLLEGERARLRTQIGWVTNELVTQDLSLQESMPASGDSELADAASDTFTQELDAALVRRAFNRLSQVESALERIQVGQYGQCVHCGKEVAKGRLEALPWAPYCMNCAQELEVLD